MGTLVITCSFLAYNLMFCNFEPIDTVKDGGSLATRSLDWQDLSFLSCMRVTRCTTDVYDPVLHSK